MRRGTEEYCYLDNGLIILLDDKYVRELLHKHHSNQSTYQVKTEENYSKSKQAISLFEHDGIRLK